ncbi:DUF3800 domain-containing protein [Sneathiella sp.]|uniref:DUF3800 domain-containing protein n=1 Tax=Sneathiella sp. TaxID=1964365 RepID=UPI002FE24DAA
MYKYVAYIDEAGDDGLKVIRPMDQSGSSEWLILSAVVVRAEREQEVKGWVKSIQDELWNYHSKTIHFAKLNQNKKLFVCDALSKLGARYFVVCSNKKNMLRYENPRASKIPSTNWFYCWLTRILLERVTHFVHWHSIKETGTPQKVKIEYSSRGGLSYSQMSAYYDWIRYQGDNTFLKAGKIYWEVLKYELLKVYAAEERAGLQLADVVASSFFKACDIYNTGACDPRFAMLLAPKIARFKDQAREKAAGYGVKLMPNLRTANLDPTQEEVFRYYGYPYEWWDPGSSNRKGQ